MASILIAEDELLIASDLRAALEDLGYTVVGTVATGEDALRRAAETRPDLVLMDMMLRGPLDGVETASRLRARFGIPVVYVTAYADEDSIQRAKVTQPLGYLIKPFEERELRSTIETALYRHSMQAQIAARERWFVTTLHSIGDGVVATDANERVTFLNRVAETLTGWSSDEAVGRPLSDVFGLVHEGTGEPSANPVARALREGRVVALESHRALKSRTGTTVAIEDSAAPIVDEHGVTLGVVLVFRDATDERRGQQLLEQSRRELHDLIERLPDAVLVLHGRRIVYANPAWVRSLGYDSSEAMVGHELREFLHADEHPTEIDRPRPPPGTASSTAPRDCRYLRRDGQVAIFELMPDQDTSFMGAPAVVKVGRDVTDQRQLQSRLSMTDRLVSVGTMSAGVAHEINNPLAYVLTNVDHAASELPRLVDALEEASARLESTHGAAALESLGNASPREVAQRMRALSDALDDARQGAERVRNIVRDLKTFARASDDAHGAVHIEPLIESTLNLAYNEIRHHATLVKDYGDAPVVWANDSRLGQVFLNLLLNAAQSIPIGHAEHNEIRITTRATMDGHAMVSIADTGCGIPATQLKRIFDPFFTTKAVGAGTGLGLSICHGIVASLGGTIEVESVVGRGSTFTMTLPAARLERPSSLAHASKAPPVAPGRRGRILVIDDEPRVARALRRLLLSDHDVTIETRARAALDAIRAGTRYDLILCDVMMPEVTGIALYEELTSFAPDQAARVVFVTGGAFTPAARAFLDSVPNPWLEKPFDVALLRAVIRERL